MATIIPNLSTLRGMTPGERRLGQRLESLLEDDYIVWYDTPVGRNRRYPDYIILHPGRGLLFLEVKDWKLDTLKQITPRDVEIHTPDGLKTVSNPLQQARQYALTAINKLQRDKHLQETSSQYKGKLCFPWGYGVVFPNITRKQWNEAISEEDQELVLPPHRLICKDEMTATADPEVFQERLWGMFDYAFGDKLSLPQIDRIRWNLFPEIRINTPQKGLFDDGDSDENADAENGPGPNADDKSAAKNKADYNSIPDIVRVMDLQQEQLARSMGDGHRVIHGVAGSGKTLILCYRCQHLAQAVTKPILVLCFNITLAARLRSFIVEKDIEEKVQVHHFHEWCGRQLKTYNVDLLPATPGRQYWERQVDTVIHAVDKGQIPRAQYSAVMIDEGHDFEQDWLALIVQMIDPNTNSLLLLYDDAQSIYKKRSLKFPLSSAGIQARGRTTILKLNYRNTREILSYAYNFAKDFLQAQDADDDHIPLIAPEVAGTSGPAPEFRKFDNFNDEAHYIARCIRKWHQNGQPLNNIAVIYGYTRQAETLQRALKAVAIPHAWLKDSASKKAYDANADRIALLTRQSSKGLEFDTVVLAGLGGLKDDEENLESEVKLLYVGMTRARKQLLLTGSGENWFVERIGG
ncbi:NERD domain-containing protein [Microbulbifer thermotolerans]|uniref:3'-5' exonuclease n=1 Tax=Microbulbifer thermotolerans TaxID=252514 RepID=UPI00224B85E7|nr:3'-5' exonuclease [Microbulbifer thermotolerans]MCX2783024.1 NERD domain-containing protein [Microbulbifer thermotolerans]